LKGAYNRNILREQRQHSPFAPPHHGAGDNRCSIILLVDLTSCTHGSPIPPTNETVNPAFASDTAWYCMRGDRPKSPSTTTVMFGNSVDVVLFFFLENNNLDKMMKGSIIAAMVDMAENKSTGCADVEVRVGIWFCSNDDMFGLSCKIRW